MAIDKNLVLTGNDHMDAESGHESTLKRHHADRSGNELTHDITDDDGADQLNVQILDDDTDKTAAQNTKLINSRGEEILNNDDKSKESRPDDPDTKHLVTCEAQPKPGNQKDEEDSNKAKGLPIDRGWAWVVLAGATLYLMLFGGIRKNFGIFFVAFQERFESSASLTSALNTMQNLVMSTSSLLIMTVGMQYLSNRTSIILGSLFLTSANLITAFSRDIRLLFLSVGFLEGAGTALVHPPVTACLGEYFHKRRGLANGLAFSGASFGGLIFAPIMSALFENYGYTGTLLIVAGLMLNILITGALLRPIKSFEETSVTQNCENFPMSSKQTNGETRGNGHLTQTNTTEPMKIKLQGESLEINGTAKETDTLLEQLVHEKENGHLQVLPNKAILKLKADATPTLKIFRSDSCHVENDKLSGSPLLPRIRAWSMDRPPIEHKRHRTTTECSQRDLSPLNNFVDSLSQSRVAIFSGAAVVCGSVIDIQEIPFKEENLQTGKCKSTFFNKLKASFDLSLFKNLVFPIFLCMAAMFAPTCGLLPVFLAPLSKDAGVSAEQTGLLLSIVSGVGMFSRIICALFADKKLIKLTTLLAVAGTIAGITAHCVRFFCTSFASLVFISVILGLCCELYQSMYPVILVEYLTLPKLKSCLGFTILCHGLAVAGTFPVIGTLRDVSGKYYASYHFLGTMSIVGAGLALLIPYAHTKQTSRQQIIVKV